MLLLGVDGKEALEAARAAVDRLPMSRDAMVGAYNLERLTRVEAQAGETSSAIARRSAFQRLVGAAEGEAVR